MEVHAFVFIQIIMTNMAQTITGGIIMNVISGKIDCKPIETGYDESRIEMLNKRLGEMMDKKIIHGAAYCISHKGKVIAHGALGRNNGMGTDAPMRPDTVFGIASITKTFTVTAIMQLVEDGYGYDNHKNIQRIIQHSGQQHGLYLCEKAEFSLNRFW